MTSRVLSQPRTLKTKGLVLAAAACACFFTGLARAEFPRVGIYWLGDRDLFLSDGNGVMEMLALLDVAVISPSPGRQIDLYRQRLAEARDINPGLMVFRYHNPTEFNTAYAGWESGETVLDEYFVNPNRGGNNLANDGLLRRSDGTLVNYFYNNLSANILDFVRPYDGKFGTPSSFTDLSKPYVGETVLDYMSRSNYVIRIRPVEDYIDGIYTDLFRAYPKRSADWNNDGINSGNGPGTEADIQRAWREAQIRNRDNLVGSNFRGGGAPNARSNGRAWMSNGGYFLGNVSAWSVNSQSLEALESGKPMRRIPEYDGAVHGGVDENTMGGRDFNPSGIKADGTRGPYRSGSLDLALTKYTFRLSHALPIPELGYTATIFEALASTLQMARYSFAAALLTDGVINLKRWENDHAARPPWMLDEFVGEDISRLSPEEISARRNWLGHSRDPAFPDNPRRQNGRVHIREFDHGMVVVLAGKSFEDDHLTAVVDVNLPDPGEGFEWRRIAGGQDAAWNNGARVGSRIRLGTPADSIDNNAVILRRVRTSRAPKPPTLFIDS